jgi:hypothetical protein
MRGQARRSMAVAVTALATLLAGCRAKPGAGDGGAGAEAEASVSDAAPGFDADPPPDEAIPSASTEELASRARHLLEAIGKDDAELASDILFPRNAWIATRDSADPGKEWAKRLFAPFRRAVHSLAKRHAAVDAQFVSFQLGHLMQQEVPRKHAWKKPLWTVRESRITYVVAGRTRVLSIREMTAWRGAWYVTRLR